MSSTLIVNLTKLDHNLEAVKKRLKEVVQRMAVIKDNAYGHGLLPIAQHLKEKVEWFCVAKVEEAVKLREDGIKNPILVFEIPPIGKESLYSKFNLTASIADLSVFERLEEGTNCHFNFDTGMGRLGILPEEAETALEKMNQFPALNYSGIYTHFANADLLDHPSVRRQIETFSMIRSKFPEDLMTHTANSGAIFYYENAGLQFDGVRPGVCLFGYAPGPHEVPELEAIVEWRSNLVQVKKISKGNPVGYGSRWQAPHDGWIGIIPVGYASGIPRSMSGKFEVEIAGKLFPQVGTVSMDYSSVFLGEHKLSVGEEVTILKSGDLSVRKWAEMLETIPYEILTGINNEVVRDYVKD